MLPDFLSPGHYVQYLLDYARHLELLDHIRCKTLVTGVRRRQGGGHVVTTTLDRETKTCLEHSCDAVIVCSGLNLTPNIPADIENLIPAQPPANKPSSTWAVTTDEASPSDGNDSNPPDSWINRISSRHSALPAPGTHRFRILHSSTSRNLPGQANQLLPPIPPTKIEWEAQSSSSAQAKPLTTSPP